MMRTEVAELIGAVSKRIALTRTMRDEAKGERARKLNDAIRGMEDEKEFLTAYLARRQQLLEKARYEPAPASEMAIAATVSATKPAGEPTGSADWSVMRWGTTSPAMA